MRRVSYDDVNKVLCEIISRCSIIPAAVKATAGGGCGINEYCIVGPEVAVLGGGNTVKDGCLLWAGPATCTPLIETPPVTFIKAFPTSKFPRLEFPM